MAFSDGDLSEDLRSLLHYRRPSVYVMFPNAVSLVIAASEKLDYAKSCVP